MADVAVVILTYNEEIHIARAIGSVASFAKEIFVIDSYSRDRTAQIARELGAQVLQHEFVNYAKQFQWAIDHAPIGAGWVFRLDADEIVSDDLADEIQTRLAGLPANVVGVNLKRRHIFLGRWIRHGGRYPLVLLRIFRNGHARVENRWMDEHMIVEGGEVLTFANDFADVNLNGLSFFTAKHNAYASREAIDVLNAKYGLSAGAEALSASSTGFQAMMKRRIKERIYNKMPFWAGPTLYFAYRLIVQRGFLDGKEGLIYHVLQGFWYRFLVGAKLTEFERGLSGLNTVAARVEALERITGYKLQVHRAD